MHPRWTVLSAAALVLTATRAHADDCATDAEPAKCYLAAGQALKDSDPGEAAKLFLASYRLDPKIDPLAGYGTSLALAQQYVAAVEALEKAVEEYDKLDAQLRQSGAPASTLNALAHRIRLVRSEINALASKTAKVKVRFPDDKLPDGMTLVRKDGGSELRPSDPTRFVIKPGGDILVFTFPSGRVLEHRITAAAGTATTIDAPPEPPPEAVAPPPERPDTRDPAARYRLGAYVSGGVGAALLVGGIGYIAVADGASAGVSAALIGGGLLGIGAGVGLWFLAERKGKPASTAVVPVASDHMIGAVLVGRL